MELAGRKSGFLKLARDNEKKSILGYFPYITVNHRTSTNTLPSQGFAPTVPVKICSLQSLVSAQVSLSQNCLS